MVLIQQSIFQRRDRWLELIRSMEGAPAGSKCLLPVAGVGQSCLSSEAAVRFGRF